jgi:hypothetical protein
MLIGGGTLRNIFIGKVNQNPAFFLRKAAVLLSSSV